MPKESRNRHIEPVMDALSNARITVENSGNGPKPITLPKAEHTDSGVSVEYAFDPDKRWFVLRASYGRTGKVSDMLINAGYYVYLAQRYEYRLVDGHRRRELKELIPNIVFAYARPSEIKTLLSRRAEHPSPLPALAALTTFYYNHFVGDGINPPLEVPAQQMLRFIEMTMSKDENIVYVSDSNIVHVKNNDYVRVRDGRFKGCMGKVVRIAGQQRVGLQLAELGWVATSYVPTAFLEVITKDKYDNHLKDIKNAATATEQR